MNQTSHTSRNSSRPRHGTRPVTTALVTLTTATAPYYVAMNTKLAANALMKRLKMVTRNIVHQGVPATEYAFTFNGKPVSKIVGTTLGEARSNPYYRHLTPPKGSDSTFWMHEANTPNLLRLNPEELRAAGKNFGNAFLPDMFSGEHTSSPYTKLTGMGLNRKLTGRLLAQHKDIATDSTVSESAQKMFQRLAKNDPSVQLRVSPRAKATTASMPGVNGEEQSALGTDFRHSKKFSLSLGPEPVFRIKKTASAVLGQAAPLRHRFK